MNYAQHRARADGRAVIVDRGMLGERGSTFSVLTVCSVNRYRSPLAEHLLRQSLQQRGLDWDVRSAGIAATPGEAMEPQVEAILVERGIEVRDWRSTRLEPSLINSADLILTADKVQRRQVVLLNAAGVRRTFTLLNFARLASIVPSLRNGTPVNSGADLLKATVEARAHLQPAQPDAENIADPARGPLRAVRDCAAVISLAVDQITAAISK